MQLREIVAAMKCMAELHLISLFCFWCESRKHLKIQEKQHLKHQQEPSVQKLPKVGLEQKSIARSSFKPGHLCFNPDFLWQSSAQKCAPKVTRTDFIHHLWSFFWIMLLSDNFFTWLYLVLFNKSPFPTLYQFTVYHICELLCHGLAQSLPHRKTVCWGWQTLTLLTALLSLVIGVLTKDILQHAVFGRISHMKARPELLMAVISSIWFRSGLAFEGIARCQYSSLWVLLQWRKYCTLSF